MTNQKIRHKGTRTRLKADPALIQRVKDLEARLQAIEDLERRLEAVEALLPGIEATELKAKRIHAEAAQAAKFAAHLQGRPFEHLLDHARGHSRVQDAVRRKMLAYRPSSWN